VTIGVLPLNAGDVFELTFEEVRGDWRQGVWLATSGELGVADALASQLVIWSDSSPSTVRITCNETSSGVLTYYNVWDSGRGMGPWESQGFTAGMLIERLPGGGVRCRTQDISTGLAFDRSVFTVIPLAATKPES
jgi:hypothetical protein